MSSEAPQFEFIGDLSDEGIEALAALLLSIAEQEEADDGEQDVCSQERASQLRPIGERKA